MENDNRIATTNLISSLFFLVLGIFMIKTDEGIVSIISKVVGALLIVVGIVKSIKYIYLKGKLGEYDIKELIFGIVIACVGVLFILFSSAFDYALSVIVGIWTLFAGINRLILALSIRNENKIGFRMYLSSSIVMILMGIILTSYLFNDFLGIFIIIYAISEIVDYIYSRYHEKKNNKDNSIVKKQKKIKNEKVIDAIIEEDK